jgi:hypothetical protein
MRIPSRASLPPDSSFSFIASDLLICDAAAKCVKSQAIATPSLDSRKSRGDNAVAIIPKEACSGEKQRRSRFRNRGAISRDLIA